MSPRTRRTPGVGAGGTGNARVGVGTIHGTSPGLTVRITGDPEIDAAEILEHLDPKTAECLGFELQRTVDRILRPTRRSPYIGPSCDHPAGYGWVWYQTHAERERIGRERR